MALGEPQNRCQHVWILLKPYTYIHVFVIHGERNWTANQTVTRWCICIYTCKYIYIHIHNIYKYIYKYTYSFMHLYIIYSLVCPWHTSPLHRWQCGTYLDQSPCVWLTCSLCSWLKLTSLVCDSLDLLVCSSLTWINWVWLLGWLIHDRAIWTRIDLLWISTSTGTALLLISKSFQGPKRKDKKLIVFLNISITLENCE